MSQVPEGAENVIKDLQAAIARRDGLGVELSWKREVLVALRTNQQEPKRPEFPFPSGSDIDIGALKTAEYGQLQEALERVAKTCGKFVTSIEALDKEIGELEEEQRK